MAKPGRKIKGEEPRKNRFTILFTDSEVRGLEIQASKFTPPVSTTFLVRSALEEKYPRIFKGAK